VNPRDTNSWSPNLTGPAPASRTWNTPNYDDTFVRNDGMDPQPNLWDLRTGAIIHADWDPNHKPDGN
jgi:hypothetical protein